MNAALKNQLMDTKRREVTYEQVLEQAFFFEDVLKNAQQPHSDTKLHSTLITLRVGKCGSLIDKVMFYWYTLVKPKVFAVVALIAMIMSI